VHIYGEHFTIMWKQNNKKGLMKSL